MSSAGYKIEFNRATEKRHPLYKVYDTNRRSLKLVLDEGALSPSGDSKLPCSTARGAQVIEKCWLLSKVIEIISILLERSKTARSTPTMTTIRHAEGRHSSALYQVLEMVRELVE
jgi:hypothetical protein